VLHNKVSEFGWERKGVVYSKIDASSLKEFPKMTEAELLDLIMGVYQIKQA